MLLLTIVLSLVSQSGQESAGAKETRLDKDQLKKWVEFYRQEAEEYDIYLGDDRKTELQFRPEPVFRWASPNSDNEFNGVIFVWTHQGRPEVLGSIWSAHSKRVDRPRTIAHTFHSLALQPLTADRKQKRFWYPRTGGVDFKPVPGAPVPAASARGRLSQMRNLSRQFTADEEVKTDVRESLRLLSQPIYRYETKSADQDGAIFTFLLGWDPEVVLIIESRQTTEGPRWHYSPIRFGYQSTRVKHNDKEVWNYQRGGPMRDPKHYYYSVHGASRVDRYIKTTPKNDEQE